MKDDEREDCPPFVELMEYVYGLADNEEEIKEHLEWCKQCQEDAALD